MRRIPVHGGGLRVYLKRGETPDVYPDSVRAVLDFERDAGLYETQPYERFAREIDSIRRDVRSTLGRLRAEGKTIAAFGASAKGAVLLNAVDADAETISFIVDDTPEKQGLIAPGREADRGTAGLPADPGLELHRRDPRSHRGLPRGGRPLHRPGAGAAVHRLRPDMASFGVSEHAP